MFTFPFYNGCCNPIKINHRLFQEHMWGPDCRMWRFILSFGTLHRGESYITVAIVGVDDYKFGASEVLF